MKKILLLGILIFTLTGCTSIEKESYQEVIDEVLNSKVSITNVNRNGYRYYLPRGLSIKNSKSFNEVLTDQKYTYYLYVDVVSYLNKTNFKYEVNEDSIYSSFLQLNDKKGYIEINNYKNNQYLIEIMYNYAKIEIVAYTKDINKCITYAMVVLSSVTYNDSVIEKYLSSSTLDSPEETFDIFEIVGSDNYLKFTEEDTDTGDAKDPDYIK